MYNLDQYFLKNDSINSMIELFIDLGIKVDSVILIP